MKKPFRYKITPRSNEGRADMERAVFITLHMTQEEFEDYQLMKDMVHAAIAEIGWKQSEVCDWHEAPEYPSSLFDNLRAAIGCKDDAVLIPYYQHSFNHRHYRSIRVAGQNIVYQLFSRDHFIKFASGLM